MPHGTNIVYETGCQDLRPKRLGTTGLIHNPSSSLIIFLHSSLLLQKRFLKRIFRSSTCPSTHPLSFFLPKNPLFIFFTGKYLFLQACIYSLFIWVYVASRIQFLLLGCIFLPVKVGCSLL